MAKPKSDRKKEILVIAAKAISSALGVDVLQIALTKKTDVLIFTDEEGNDIEIRVTGKKENVPYENDDVRVTYFADGTIEKNEPSEQ